MTSHEHSLAPKSTSGSVLVVDDHAAVRRLLSLALESAGLEVVEASTRFDAQRRLAHARPAALVLDFQRAEVDGLDLLRRVRARSDFDGVPVVFMAGYGDDELRWRAMRAGADWFAVRPLGMIEFQRRVGTLVRNGRPRLRAIAGTLHRLNVRPLKRTG